MLVELVLGREQIVLEYDVQAFFSKDTKGDKYNYIVLLLGFQGDYV